MAQYYADHPSITCQTLATRESPIIADAPILSEFDKLRKTLLVMDTGVPRVVFGWPAPVPAEFPSRDHGYGIPAEFPAGWV